jgi:hypothetical protein
MTVYRREKEKVEEREKERGSQPTLTLNHSFLSTV